jgi:hypothetical protein
MSNFNLYSIKPIDAHSIVTLIAILRLLRLLGIASSDENRPFAGVAGRLEVVMRCLKQGLITQAEAYTMLGFTKP